MRNKIINKIQNSILLGIFIGILSIVPVFAATDTEPMARLPDVENVRSGTPVQD